MSDGDESRVLESEGDGGNGLDTGKEAVDEVVFINIQDRGFEHVALVKNLDHGHTVRERRNVQHVQEGCLGRSNTGTGDDDALVGNDFNGTTSDLGGDTEGLEEGRLAGFHSGVTCGHSDILGGESTSPSGSSDLVGGKEVTDVFQIRVGENEADVAFDVREETFELGVIGEDGSDDTANHGVLAHEHDTLAAEGDTDLMHLVGTDVIDIDDEDGGWEVDKQKETQRVED